MWVEIKKGVSGWSSNLNPVFKCLHMSAFGLDRTGEQSYKGFPPWGNPPEQSQLSAPLLFHLLFFSYYQWVRLDGKQGGDGRGKVWHLFLTQHMCVCLKIVCCTNWGLFLLMRARRLHTPESSVCADAWEWGLLGGGMWDVGCDSYSACFNCLCLHKALPRTRSLHSGTNNVAENLVVGFIIT